MATPLTDAYGLPFAGTTAQRPTNASTGKIYYDQTLGQFLVWDDSISSGAWQVFTPSGNSGQTTGAFNGYVHRQTLPNARNANGSVLVASSAAAGNFLIANTLGTSAKLTGEGADNNTKTDIAYWEFELPASYVAGANITMTINALYANSSGTVLTNTVVGTAYLLADAGTSGANLVATSAKALTTSAADYTFTVTGTGLVSGNRLIFGVTSVATEAGATGTVTNTVNSLRLS